MINYYVPLLYKWLMTHLPRKWHFVDNMGALKWSQRFMSLNVDDIVWYNHDYDGIYKLFSYGDFHNVHIIGTKGSINYNLVLSLHQLGHLVENKPEDGLLEEFVLAEGVDDP